MQTHRFQDMLTADRRLALLQALANAAEYTAPLPLLSEFLVAVGHRVTQDVVAGDLAWLAEQQLVATDASRGVTIATLTIRGVDVANGRSQVPGVKRPPPGALATLGGS